MKEHPILFSAPMVRAILEDRKTQTRRIVKPQPDGPVYLPEDPKVARYCRENHEAMTLAAWAKGFSPYGQPGDRLWVRETWQGPLMEDMCAYRAEPSDFHKPEFCEYAADGRSPPEFVNDDDELKQCWRPSIFMPRWASRITLELTDVRVERLQEITLIDCEEEGVGHVGPQSAQARYRELWDSLNAKRAPWASNPWVWVLVFKRLTP